MHHKGLVKEDCALEQKSWDAPCAADQISCECEFVGPALAMRHADLLESPHRFETWDLSRGSMPTLDVSRRQSKSVACYKAACLGGLGTACSKALALDHDVSKPELEKESRGDWGYPTSTRNELRAQGCKLGQEALCLKYESRTGLSVTPGAACKTPPPDESALHELVSADDLELMRAVCDEAPVVTPGTRGPIVSCLRCPAYLRNQQDQHWSLSWTVKGSFLVAGREEALLEMQGCSDEARNRLVLLVRNGRRWERELATAASTALELPLPVRSAQRTDQLVSVQTEGGYHNGPFVAAFRLSRRGVETTSFGKDGTGVQLRQASGASVELGGLKLESGESAPPVLATRVDEGFSIEDPHDADAKASPWRPFVGLETDRRSSLTRAGERGVCPWDDCDPPVLTPETTQPLPLALQPPNAAELSAFLSLGAEARPLNWGDDGSGWFRLGGGRASWQEPEGARCLKPGAVSISAGIVAFSCVVAGRPKRFELEVLGVSVDAMLYRWEGLTFLVYGCTPTSEALTCRTRVNPVTVRLIRGAGDASFASFISEVMKVPDTPNTPIFLRAVQSARKPRSRTEIYYGSRVGRDSLEQFKTLVGTSSPLEWAGGGLVEDLAIVVGGDLP